MCSVQSTQIIGILGAGQSFLGTSGLPLAIFLCERLICKEAGQISLPKIDVVPFLLLIKLVNH